MTHCYCFQLHPVSRLISKVTKQGYKRRNLCIIVRLYALVLLLVLILVSGPQGTEAQGSSCSIPIDFEDRSLVQNGVGAGAKGFVIGDFNGDGKPDIATILAF